MTARASGIDVSSWQHPKARPIDWEKVAEDGYTFAMIKATQGDTYTSPYFADDVVAAHKAGLIVGAYHFYVPGAIIQEQCSRFIGACHGHVLELGAWLDWEPGAMPDYLVTSEYNAMVAGIEEARNPVGLYCDLSWHATFERLNLVAKRLWIADPSNDPLPSGVSIVQRSTEAVGGIVGQVDIDELVSIRGVDLPRPTPATTPVEPQATQTDADADADDVAKDVADPDHDASSSVSVPPA